MQIIGREQEIFELGRLMDSGRPEFVAVYGRRRVGKTFLIREYFKGSFAFYATGMARGNYKDQLTHFYETLVDYGLPKQQSTPKDWRENFRLLQTLIEKKRGEGRKVIFLDEVPWMDTQKSNFIQALDLFWNTWASARTDIVLIVCGSAAGWMVKNIVRNTGGLHNRLTCQMRIQPFTLKEVNEFLRSHGILWSAQTVAECYMIMGGIPYYLQYLDKSMSLAQNIDRLFFRENALLQDEYTNLFRSLFKHSEEYVKIVEALARKRCGLTRNEIIECCKITNGGGLTRRLEELEQCGFIRPYSTIGNANTHYQLVDFYTLFYHTFLTKAHAYDDNAWMYMQSGSRYNTWLGLSFERLCFAHLREVRQALSIGGVATKTFALRTESAQIDMLIERADKTITVCEIKWSGMTEYTLSKAETSKILERLDVARLKYPRRNVMLCMITSAGIKRNEYVTQYVNNVISLEDFF